MRNESQLNSTPGAVKVSIDEPAIAGRAGRAGRAEHVAGAQTRDWRTADPDFPADDPAMPILKWIELPIGVEEFWHAYVKVRDWPEWNKSLWYTNATDGGFRPGGALYVVFNSIWWFVPYKMPAVGRIIDVEPYSKITWEIRVGPFFSAKHVTLFESLGPEKCRLGWWELSEGVLHRNLRWFFLQHYRFVSRETLIGAQKLARELQRR